MNKFLFVRFQDSKLWLQSKMPWIKIELISLVKSFLTGFLGYIVVNWTTTSGQILEDGVFLGLMVAAARSGVKVMWAVLTPKILKLLNWLYSFVKRG